MIPLRRYSESVKSSTSHRSLRQDSAWIAASISMRLLVVAISPPKNSFWVTPCSRMVAQPPGPGFPSQAPSVWMVTFFTSRRLPDARGIVEQETAAQGRCGNLRAAVTDGCYKVEWRSLWSVESVFYSGAHLSRKYAVGKGITRRLARCFRRPAGNIRAPQGCSRCGTRSGPGSGRGGCSPFGRCRCAYCALAARHSTAPLRPNRPAHRARIKRHRDQSREGK